MKYPENKIFIETFGHEFELRFVARLIEEANNFCAANPDCGVIFEDDRGIFVASIEAEN